MDSNTVIKKETKNKIRVDFEGKMTFKERLLNKLKSSNTWIKALVNLFRFVLMLGVSFVIIYPFISRIAGSFMTKEDVIDATVSLIPKTPTLEIYKALIVENHYFDALLNTVLLSLFCAIAQTMVACVIGYGLAKFKFKGNKLLMAMVVVTMVIPHSTLQLSMLRHFTDFDLGKVMAWNYPGIIDLVVDPFLEAGQLDLTETFAPMIILSICGLAFKNGLYIYLMRQFFKGVPDELEESAYVDGAGVFRTFVQIILPLCVPMMITIFLFSFSWQWTDEFYPTLFFKSTLNKVYLMPDIYKTIPESLTTTYAGKTLYYNVIQNTAGIMIILPIVILYLFCQRYLVEGIERSGIVG